MILIEANIKPFKLDDVREALDELGVGGMTVTEILQTSPKTRGRSFGSPSAETDMVPKIKIEIAAPRDMAERIIELLLTHGAGGRAEDGRISVQPIVYVSRIRTGEADGDALS
jgi:nitrogen regulatory protein PII